MISVGSLFTGIGGIDLGFKQAGFSISWANEIDSRACQTYLANFPHKILGKDIKQLEANEVSSVDILTTGFPCQAFSVAGYRRGFDDERGNLFFEIIRMIKGLSPKVIFLENVKNLQTHNNGETFKEMIKALIELGYWVSFKVLNTCKYSTLPQNRERLFVVGFKEEKAHHRFKFPLEIKETQPIQALLEKNVENDFYYCNQLLRETMHNKNTCYQWRRKCYVRENKSNLCPTLTASMGTGGHNVPLVLDNQGIRKLTPRECARFQGFPDDFILPQDLPNSSLYKQLGNSVSVPVIKEIATNIQCALK